MEVAHINNAIQNGNIKTETDSSKLYGGLQINLSVVSSPNSLKIEIKGFNNLNVLWLSNIIKKYENQLWMKLLNERRMTFKCLYCDKKLFHFHSMKTHLYKHLEIFPFKCYACDKSYTNNSGLRKHKLAKHNSLRLALLNAGH
ncbi:zinc finger protein 729-like isoform X2 [Episyrphus balteatus]|uniref:zinc finger protein 729-like isoform X2 n=1 Tax=Episyrphus balteatus TaxID=286459 RepID=UPI0024867AE8|nr:zinc finger protein 729-like isoform X2 [Episyrphus balteatus]